MSENMRQPIIAWILIATVIALTMAKTMFAMLSNKSNKSYYIATQKKHSKNLRYALVVFLD